MKKTLIYLAAGFGAAALLIISVAEYRKRHGVTQLTTGRDYLPVSDKNSYTAKTFGSFNYNLLLNADTSNAEPEITALQMLINAYYGGTPASISVTGTWTQQTENAVQDITGKSTTNLYEFRYFYFDPQRGDDAATAIFQSLTTQE